MLFTAAVVTLKFANVAPDWTVTDPGAVSVEFVFDKVTLAPPVGAACVRVIVQVLEEFELMLAGVQASEETSTDAARFTVALAEVLL